MPVERLLTVRSAALDFSMNAPEIQSLFEKAPRTTFWHVRDTMGAIYGSHRREWLQRTQVEFQRRGFRALPTNSKAQPKSRLFFYAVTPEKKTVPSGLTPNLEEITGEAYTTSEVALIQETGGTIRPKKGRMLAIPIGATLGRTGKPIGAWRTPKKYRAAKAGNKLVALKLNGRSPKLYQVRKGVAAARKAGSFSRIGEGGKKRKDRRILVPAYQLVRSVTIEPRLNFIKTWDDLASDRTRRLSRMLSRITEAIAHGSNV